jgi:hypothetical protein
LTQESRDRSKEIGEIEMRDDRVVHFEQEAQAVTLAG